MDQDMQWYFRRTAAKERSDDSISSVVRQVLDARVRMLAPFAPFISEELWELLGNDKSVTLASWPKVDEKKFDHMADESETLIINLLADAQNIVKVTKIKPKKIFVYVAAGWKWNMYQRILEMVTQGKTNFGEIMKTLVNDANTSKVKESPDMVKKMIDDILSDPLDSRQRKVKLALEEVKVFDDAKSLLGKELDSDIIIFSEEDKSKTDPKNKAKIARPYKPALYME
jgi:leucyl-tRNA synthetase